jgi:hypothetical protein
MAMQKKVWIIAFLFKEFLFKKKNQFQMGCHSPIDTFKLWMGMAAMSP